MDRKVFSMIEKYLTTPKVWRSREDFSYKGENRQKEESRLNMDNRLDRERREKEGEQERSSRPRRAA